MTWLHNRKGRDARKWQGTNERTAFLGNIKRNRSRCVEMQFQFERAMLMADRIIKEITVRICVAYAIRFDERSAHHTRRDRISSKIPAVSFLSFHLAKHYLYT